MKLMWRHTQATGVIVDVRIVSAFGMLLRQK